MSMMKGSMWKDTDLAEAWVKSKPTIFPDCTIPRQQEILFEEVARASNVRVTKPPVGIIPEHLWLEDRIQGLAGAIFRKVADMPDLDPKQRLATVALISKWISEMTVRLDNYTEAIL